MSNAKIDFNKPVSPAAGIWPCIVSGGAAGEETDKGGRPNGRIRARVNVTLDGGPDKGKSVSYEDEVTAKSSLYIGRSLKNVGWQGRSLATVEADIAAWATKTGGKSTVEIRHIEIKKGKKYEEWCEAWKAQGNTGDAPPYYWAKANSIGYGPRPLAVPAVAALSDADEAMRKAMVEDGFAPSAGGGSEPQQGGDPDDIPFLTSSMSADLGQIAKVLK